jgi:hypothetical protein
MIEQWERYTPIEGLATKYDIKSISLTKAGLTIILLDDKHNKVRVFFSNPIYSYRILEEGFRLVTMADLSERYGGDFYGYWTFLKVTHSSYAKWLSESSSNISDALRVQHFVLVTVNFFVDILHDDDPTVNFLEE